MLPRQSGDAVVLGTIVYKRMRKRKILPGIGKESAADLRFGEDAGVQHVDDQQGDVIYGLEKGQKTETVIYDADASEVMKIRAVRENNTIKITVQKTEKNMTIRTKDACEILRIEE